MAKTKTETGEKPVLTRAAKKDATKKLIKQLLEKSSMKSNDLIDEAAKIYAAQFGGEENENPNDVKGRIGSVLDVMKKENELQFDGGVYALKAEETPKVEETEKPKKARKTVKTKEEKAEEPQAKEEKKTTKRTVKKKEETSAKTDEKVDEKTPPLPVAPLQPIAPVAPITPETAPEPIPEKAPKKRGRKAKGEPLIKTALTPPEVVERTEKPVEKIAEKQEEKPAMKEEGQAVQAVQTQPMVMDMSFLFGDVKSAKKDEKADAPKEEKAVAPIKVAPKKEESTPVKAEEKSTPQATVKKQEKQPQKAQVSAKPRPQTKPKTADEKLQEAFLKRLHKLGGDYFEYYSVYLLEKYSRRNGRRLESLKISGGDHDGGIDGEIELTDRLGFRETIYIQAKNWDPDKGDERLWTVGETLLQQFIGACVYRQAKDGKQHCRGIFITTSRFTAEAKRMLEDTSDKFIGYDGADLYETAKECEFGVIKKNGEWVLDEDLLSGEKALFHIF